MELIATSKTQQALRPLRRWVTALALIIDLGLSTGITLLLWHIASHATRDQQPSLRQDAIRTGLAVAAGVGGAMALWLSVRRQRLSEYAQIDHEKTADDARTHRERTAAAAELDATERRITDLYTKAVDQLGNTKAPVRLGGLYSLERLAQNDPEHRQTIVNVICAYLRMPYTPPTESTTPTPDHATEDPDQSPTSTYPTGETTPAEELQVRLTAQRILTKHLAIPPTPPQAGATDHHWPGMSIDLAGATLTDFDLAHAVITNARFDGATFHSGTSFDGATFDDVRFANATFHDDVRFANATFHDDVRFANATFHGSVWFDDATFHRNVRFYDATFRGGVWFGNPTFHGDASFDHAAFHGTVRFYEATFHGHAWFDDATFHSDVDFSFANFHGGAGFANVTFRGGVGFDYTTFHASGWFANAVFHGSVRFANATFNMTPEFEGATTYGDARRTWPSGWTVDTQPDGTGHLIRTPTLQIPSGAQTPSL